MIAGSFYSHVISAIYLKNPDLYLSSYNVQYKSVTEKICSKAVSYEKSLSKLGYNVWTVLSCSKELQKKWAQENEINYLELDWQDNILAEQIKFFSPEVLWLYDHSACSANLLAEIREIVPSIKLVVIFSSYNDSNLEIYKYADILITSSSVFCKKFQKMGYKSFLSRAAFDASVLDKFSRVERRENFTFIGSILTDHKYHIERSQYIKELVANCGLRVWSDYQPPSLKEILKLRIMKSMNYMPYCSQRITLYKKKYGENLAIDSIPRYICLRFNKGLYGLEMLAKLAESKITFNKHLDSVSFLDSANERMYEATGMGTCLLTEWSPELKTQFDPDNEVVSYRNLAEAIDKLKYLFNNKEEVKRIAFAGQKKTLAKHNFIERSQDFDNILKKALAKTQ